MSVPSNLVRQRLEAIENDVRTAQEHREGTSSVHDDMVSVTVSRARQDIVFAIEQAGIDAQDLRNLYNQGKSFRTLLETARSLVP